jgi:anti-sigma regulatory factor (Ser/Thr protein kinase)
MDLLLELVDEWGLPEGVVDRMLLVLGEAVSNAVEHGDAPGTADTLEVSFDLDDGTVSFCVRDEGPGMKQESLDNASLPDDPMDMDGRGLYIIRETSDRVWLEDQGRRLCTSWFLPDRAA